MTTGDKLLAVAIVVAALVSGWQFYARPFSTTTAVAASAVVTARGSIVRTIPLHIDATYDIDGRLGPLRLEVAAGRIRVAQAPCPEQHCVHLGWVTRPGAAIACVPGEVVVRVAGDGGVDAVTR